MNSNLFAEMNIVVDTSAPAKRSYEEEDDVWYVALKFELLTSLYRAISERRVNKMYVTNLKIPLLIRPCNKFNWHCMG